MGFSFFYLENIRPICIPTKTEHKDDKFYEDRSPFVAGWGKTITGEGFLIHSWSTNYDIYHEIFHTNLFVRGKKFGKTSRYSVGHSRFKNLPRKLQIARS